MVLEICQEQLDEICSLVKQFAEDEGTFPLVYEEWLVDVKEGKTETKRGKDYDIVYGFVMGWIYQNFAKNEAYVNCPNERKHWELHNLQSVVENELYFNDIIINKVREIR